MKDIYKKPIFWYVAVPALLAIWPMWLIAFGIPNVKTNLTKDANSYVDGEKNIKLILSELDPQRLDYAKKKKVGEGFDFITAFSQVTQLCQIPSNGYSRNISPPRKTKGQANQDAAITIEKINIERFTKFLSVMHMRWSNLQCTNLTLSKIKGEKDLWKADVRFVYYQ